MKSFAISEQGVPTVNGVELVESRKGGAFGFKGRPPFVFISETDAEVTLTIRPTEDMVETSLPIDDNALTSIEAWTHKHVVLQGQRSKFGDVFTLELARDLSDTCVRSCYDTGEMIVDEHRCLKARPGSNVSIRVGEGLSCNLNYSHGRIELGPLFTDLEVAANIHETQRANRFIKTNPVDIGPQAVQSAIYQLLDSELRLTRQWANA